LAALRRSPLLGVRVHAVRVAARLRPYRVSMTPYPRQFREVECLEVAGPKHYTYDDEGRSSAATL
jgi:hypothetical protein